MDTALPTPSTAPDEPSLREGFRSGNESAFNEVIHRHRMAVYCMARRVLDTHEDADEAAQRAFVRAWRARQSFRGDSSLRTWLIRIVLNVAKSMRAGRAATEPFADEGRLRDPGRRSDERIGLRETRARVRSAISELPPRQREVVRLKVFSELTYREVAAVMELSEGAVKAHFHQAVSNLRRALAAASPGRGERMKA